MKPRTGTRFLRADITYASFSAAYAHSSASTLWSGTCNHGIDTRRPDLSDITGESFPVRGIPLCLRVLSEPNSLLVDLWKTVGPHGPIVHLISCVDATYNSEKWWCAVKGMRQNGTQILRGTPAMAANILLVEDEPKVRRGYAQGAGDGRLLRTCSRWTGGGGSDCG